MLHTLLEHPRMGNLKSLFDGCHITITVANDRQLHAFKAMQYFAACQEVTNIKISVWKNKNFPNKTG